MADIQASKQADIQRDRNRNLKISKALLKS